MWRSLPFFAATLALQLAALAQVRDWVAATTGWILASGEALLAVSGLMTFGGLAAVAMSVRPANFRRVAPELGLLDFAEASLEATRKLDSRTEDDPALLILVDVRRNLARQYAEAVDYNRAVMRDRLKWRTRAGLATLGSVLAVLVLVMLVVLSNIHGHG